VDIVGYARRSLTTVCIFFLLSSITISPVYGCAPATPPSVAGTLVQPLSTLHIVFINEVLSNPGSAWNCSEQGTKGTANDVWVELYNPQNQAFDLYGVHSSFDSGPGTKIAYFPFGAAIAAHGFLVIFPIISGLALPDNSPSTLRLLMSGTVIDQVTLPSLARDTSYARIPDGGDTWVVTDTPTIDASNVPPTPIPIPTRTPKPSSVTTASQKSNSNGRAGTLDGATTDTSNQPAGTQPAWNTLSVPTPMSSAPETTQGNTSNSVPPGTNTGDLPRKVLLTSLAAASLLALLWGSRFFTRAKKLSGNPTEAALTQGNDEFSEETANMPIMPDDHSLTDRK